MRYLRFEHYLDDHGKILERDMNDMFACAILCFYHTVSANFGSLRDMISYQTR